MFDHLRIAVTDRCNLRCVYCMPEGGVNFARHDTLLQTAEILRVIRVASKLGVSKVRYTGGEPLVRSDILELVDGSSTEHMNFRLPGWAGSVAFIPSYTRDFCKDCTRIRLTADGRVRESMAQIGG